MILYELVAKRGHFDGITVVNIWNSLPNDVITTASVNSSKNRLDTFWTDQEVLYNYKTKITGNRDITL